MVDLCTLANDDGTIKSQRYREEIQRIVQKSFSGQQLTDTELRIRFILNRISENGWNRIPECTPGRSVCEFTQDTGIPTQEQFATAGDLYNQDELAFEKWDELRLAYADGRNIPRCTAGGGINESEIVTNITTSVSGGSISYTATVTNQPISGSGTSLTPTMSVLLDGNPTVIQGVQEELAPGESVELSDVLDVGGGQHEVCIVAE